MAPLAELASLLLGQVYELSIMRVCRRIINTMTYTYWINKDALPFDNEECMMLTTGSETADC